MKIMGFGSVQVIQNCNGNFDVEIDGCLDREIADINDLNIFEEISVTRDRVCFFLSEFPGNAISNVREKGRNSSFWSGVKDRIDHINGM